MLNQEELKEQQENTFNNNKNLQLFIQTIVFSLLVYLSFKLINSISKNNYWYDYSLFLIIVFWCFNFPNII